jgi:molecular chaperone DnaK
MAGTTRGAETAGFAEVIPLSVQGTGELLGRYGAAFKTGATFVQRDVPPAVGTLVLLQFASSDGTPLMSVSARVIHSRPAAVPGESTAGMALELLDFDAAGKALLADLRQHDPKAAEPAPAPESRVERLAGPVTGAEGPVVGIDLGTTYSCIAAMQKGEPKVLATAQGYETVPSVVFVGADRKILAGQKALEKMMLEPVRCIYGSKRFIGRRFASKEVNAFGHFFHYGLAAAKTGFVAARIDNAIIPLEVVAAYILAHLRLTAKARIGRDVTRAIITVPAYFGETQRQAVREAGRLAGLKVERILNEPTAAAVAYGYGRGMDRRVLVYDFGGGTFDATAMRIQGDTMEVLATDGDPFLGGTDLDDRLTEFVLTNLERTHKVSVRQDAVAVQRLRFAAEAAKRELSEVESATISVPNLAVAGAGAVNVAVPVTRQLFESLTEDLIARSLGIVQRVLDSAKLRGADLDDIVMVGGQSRSPIIRRLLTERFGKQPTRGAHPDHAIALGAAIVAGADGKGPALTLKDILARSIRLGLPDGRTEPLLPRGAPLPAKKDFTVTTGADQAFHVSLYRGEGATIAENELLGEIRLPSNLALAVSRTAAQVTLEITTEGLMTVSAVHPLTSKREELRIVLPEGDPNAEALTAVDLDVIS